jgi:hypothetical protein
MVMSLRCLVLGHGDVVVRAPERLYLRCDYCGRETAGWTLTRRDRQREGRRQTVSERMLPRERRPEEKIAA